MPPRRLLDEQADDRHRQAADLIAGGGGKRRQGKRQFLRQNGADRKAEGAAERHDDSRHLLGTCRKSIAAHDGGKACERHHQRNHPQQIRPLAENRPGQDRGPYRHGVGDQRSLAGRQPEQRQSHQRHPAGDIEERRSTRRNHFARHAQALAAEDREPASRPRRPRRWSRAG
jgi:hypothetical protein